MSMLGTFAVGDCKQPCSAQTSFHKDPEPLRRPRGFCRVAQTGFLQRGLVVAQIAVSVVLLAGAGLLTRTMIHLSEVATGLKAEEVLAIEVPLLKLTGGPSNGDAAGWYKAILESDAMAKQQYERMKTEIRALPGVNEVGVGSTIPLRASSTQFELKAEGKQLAVGEAIPRPDTRTANPEYFRAAGIPLLEGREFSITDAPRSGMVVIVNKTLADQLFPGESPIGKRIAWTGELLKLSPISGEWRTIVGVVGNTQDGGPTRSRGPSCSCR